MQVGRGLALQGDGKLVLVGSAIVQNPTRVNDVTHFAVMRLNADGSADTSFGAGGLVTTSISGQGDQAHAVALQANGRILVAGQGSIINNDFALARYNSDGSLDVSFNAGGKLEIDFFGSTDRAENIALQPDGKIVLGGLARDNVDGYGLARVNP